MNVWERITGKDITKALKAFEVRAQTLPPDYEGAWQKIKTQLWSYSDFSGRNLLPMFDSVLGLLEESALDGLAIEEVLGKTFTAFARPWWAMKARNRCATAGANNSIKALPKN